MQNFLFQQQVLVVEHNAFRDRCIVELQWSETQFYNRLVGRTAVTPAECIAMGNILRDLREEVKKGQLDLIKYNTK